MYVCVHVSECRIDYGSGAATPQTYMCVSSSSSKHAVEFVSDEMTAVEPTSSTNPEIHVSHVQAHSQAGWVGGKNQQFHDVLARGTVVIGGNEWARLKLYLVSPSARASAYSDT